MHLVIGTGPAGNKCRVGRLVGTGLIQLSVINPTSPIVDLAIVDVLSAANPEIAILTQDGLTVYSIDGTPLDSVPAALVTARGAIECLANSNSTESIGWITPSASGAQWLARVVRGPTSLILDSVMVQIGSGVPNNVGLHGASAGDSDGDGFDDLVLTIDSVDWPLLWLDRNASGTGFVGGKIAELPGIATTPVTLAFAARLDGSPGDDLFTVRSVNSDRRSVFARTWTRR